MDKVRVKLIDIFQSQYVSSIKFLLEKYNIQNYFLNENVRPDLLIEIEKVDAEKMGLINNNLNEDYIKLYSNTLIEPIYDSNDSTIVVNYRVVAQDNSFPVPIFYGTYEECFNFKFGTKIIKG
jgi:hypothetical protein